MRCDSGQLPGSRAGLGEKCLQKRRSRLRCARCVSVCSCLSCCVKIRVLICVFVGACVGLVGAFSSAHSVCVCMCVYVLLLGMLGCEKCAKRGREIRPLARPDETPPVRAMGAGPDWLCVPAGSIPQHPFHCRWIHQAGQKL